jgi:tRNA (guanine37-N1)-methyltransferase
MRIDILTLFPEMFEGPFGVSIIKRAVEQELVEIKTHNIRDYTHDAHRTVDDTAYGGGAGMVLKPEPVFEAAEAVFADIGLATGEKANFPVVLLTPQGRVFKQEIAQKFSQRQNMILICGRYEGVDERIREHLVNDEVSIGDYVLGGGELAAMVVVDAVVRNLPGALGSDESLLEESHTGGLLEYPQYTRPADYRGWRVPEILLSGNHGEVARWRRRQAIGRTATRRPDMLEQADLTAEENLLAQDWQTAN